MSSIIAEYLAETGHLSPSADNSQPWHFVWDGANLILTYDTDRVSGITFPPEDAATLLSMGGVIENLYQAVDQIGIREHVEFIHEMDLKTTTYFRLRLNPSASTELPKNRFDLPLFHRHTNRLPFSNKVLDSDLIDLISSWQEMGSTASVISEPQQIRSIANLVCKASEIRFQTKEVHEWLGKSLRFNTDKAGYGDGLDVKTLDLPPGGIQLLKFISDWDRMAFLNQLGAYKMLSKIDSAPVGKAPTIVAIISPREDEQIIAAGRLLTRIWTKLNSEGVAVHPYYVIPDQIQRLHKGQIPKKLLPQANELEEKTGEILGLKTSSEELRMLLRVGYPIKIPFRSKRLPLNAVFTDDS